MTTKEKLLLAWILVAVAANFVCNHFCGGAIHVLENSVAFSLVSRQGFAIFGTGLLGIHLLL